MVVAIALVIGFGAAACADVANDAQTLKTRAPTTASAPSVTRGAVVTNEGEAETLQVRAERERPVPGRLRLVEANASLGPAPRGTSVPFSAAGARTFLFAPGDGGSSGAPVAALVPLPASAESILPGDCTGGPHPGTPCTVTSDCGSGGTCRFFRTDAYRNEGVVGFNSPSNPRTALDDLVLAGAYPTPPARISSVEVAFVVIGSGVAAGSTLRIEVRFWDDIDPAAPAGTPVESGFLGGAAFTIAGPLDAGPQVVVGTLPSALAIAPDDPTVGYQLDFRDDASGALAFATPFFYGQGAQTGASSDIYWRDANANGRFDASDARQFGGVPTLANFYAHLGVETPVNESEPNGSQATATVTASCLTLAASIDPAGDVDWYRFTLFAAQTVLCEVRSASPADDSTLALRGSGGALIEFNDDAGPSNHGSRILRSLAAGTYYLEVHEKNDDEMIPLYQAYVGPAPPAVTDLRFASNKHAIAWDPITGGAPYDILYGFLGALHESGFAASVGGCLGDNLFSPSSDDTDTPAPGDGFWYLSRSRDPCAGTASTYDEGGAQVFSRDPLVPPPPIDCSRP